MKKIFYFGIVAFLMASCATEKTVYTYSEYRTTNPSQSVATAPLIADLVVSENRISYAERINTVISNKTVGEAKSLADKEKEVVISNAIKANKADVLVAPIVNIQTDDNGFLVIEVSGYPASYKNFRNAAKDDMWIVNHATPEQPEKKAIPSIALPGKKK